MASHIVPTEAAPVVEPDQAGLQTLAGSVIHEFRERGYSLRHIIMLASELVGLACDAVRAEPAGRRQGTPDAAPVSS
jgi:hypothetical protein